MPARVSTPPRTACATPGRIPTCRQPERHDCSRVVGEPAARIHLRDPVPSTSLGADGAPIRAARDVTPTAAVPDSGTPRAPDLQEHQGEAVSEGGHGTYAHAWALRKTSVIRTRCGATHQHLSLTWWCSHRPSVRRRMPPPRRG